MPVCACARACVQRQYVVLSWQASGEIEQKRCPRCAGGSRTGTQSAQCVFCTSHSELSGALEELSPFCSLLEDENDGET